MQNIFPNAGAGLSMLLGLMALIWPAKTESFVSIKSVGKEGASEIRATYGGFFVGISLFALMSQSPVVFAALGIGWLSAAVVRFVTLLFGFATPKNIGGVVMECVIGVMCVSGLFI